MKKGHTLSVRERVDAALILLRKDNPRARITVSELCRTAGVSRANLYASHRDVVQSLRVEARSSPRQKKSSSTPPVMKQLREKLAAEARKNHALVYLVTELRAELQRERVRHSQMAAVKGLMR